MRRTTAFLAVLGAVVLALPAAASAIPTVAVKGEAVPIKGFPGTGNFYGAGAAVQAEVTISGTEYAGGPPPLIGANVYLPKFVKLHPQGFKTCPTATIAVEKNPKKCPKGSAAGPVGEANGFVSLGNERVEEKVSIESFYAPGGGLNFYAEGSSPTQIEVASTGHYTNLNGAGGYGPELMTKIPLVETLPGAPDASVASIKVKAGSARWEGKGKHRKAVYYGTVPKKGQCPKGGFKVKAELIFAENGNESTPITVTKLFRSPCPRK